MMSVEIMRKALLKAIKKNDYDSLSVSDMSAMDKHGQNGLFYAVRQKSLELTNYMIEKGVDVDRMSKRGQTPLHLAALMGEQEVVRTLLDADATVNARNNKGITPLMLAAEKGALDCVKILIERGADIHATDALGNSTLFHAMRSKKTDVLTHLLNAGVNPHRLNFQNENLQHEAARYGTASMQMQLFKLHITPYIKNIYGQSPLHLASQRGDESLVSELLSSGLMPGFKDRFEHNAYDYARNFGEIITLFSRFDNDMHIKNAYKEQPLHRALREESIDEAEAYIRMETKLNEKDVFGNKPLFYILLLKDPLLLRIMLKRIWDLKGVDHFNRPAAFYAALQEYTLFFELTGMKKDDLDKETQSLIESSLELSALLDHEK